MLNNTNNRIIIVFAALVIFDALLWVRIFNGTSGNLQEFFLNVGQGDSHLINLPSGVQVLIDGGPDGRVLGELSKVLASTDRYIDLVMLTHADLDHIGGLPDVLKRYRVGAFIFNGRSGENSTWQELVRVLEDRNIPIVVVQEGDKIINGNDELKILSPGKDIMWSAAPNDACIVSELVSKNSKTLFACDIAFTTENYILEKYDLNADILKVAHHGSKFATSKEFLAEVTPNISVIQVGKNRYGHPTANVLDNLKLAGGSFYRNDLDGTVTLEIDGQNIKVIPLK
ncbi:MAG: MBL fold metallo-hydrolase [Candidatus Liptonbacteria bacterium]|nr:MBL fold metallo-hydrolase [Candidatus Liptonbacteria bacterium]